MGDSLVGLDTGQKTTGRRNDTSSALLCSEAAAVSQFASVPVCQCASVQLFYAGGCGQHARAPDSPFILHQIVLQHLCIVYFEIYFNLFASYLALLHQTQLSNVDKMAELGQVTVQFCCQKKS